MVHPMYTLMNCQLYELKFTATLLNDLLDKAQQDLFKEDEVSHQDKDKDFEQDQDDLTISTFDPSNSLKKQLMKKL